jgi:histidinol-phosphate aminotransferase
MNNEPSLTPAARMQGLSAYAPPKPPGRIDLRLSGNEGQAPQADLLAALQRHAPEVFRQYPSAAELEAALAEPMGAAADRVLVTAGADDALYRTCLAFLEPGREMVIPEPTFEMLDRYAALAGGAIRRVQWPRGDYPLAEVLRSTSARTALVTVVSPNSPTGAVATASDLRELAERLPTALILLDAAYVDFADEDLTGAALALPNALVLRTFSKAWGLAGLRVGYAIGRPQVIRWLRAAGNPYAVSGPSLALALACLRAGQAHVGSFVQRIRTERQELFDLLRMLGAAPLPSQANFVFSEFDDAESVWRRLATGGIAVRWFGEDPRLRKFLRITCPGNARDFERLCKALENALSGTRAAHDPNATISDTVNRAQE